MNSQEEIHSWKQEFDIFEGYHIISVISKLQFWDTESKEALHMLFGG